MGNAITALNWPLKSDFLEILDGDLWSRGIGYADADPMQPESEAAEAHYV